MKKMAIGCLVFAALLSLTGCGLFGRNDDMPLPDYRNIEVSVREGARLKQIIAVSAERRGWAVRDAGDNMLRLTISQRSNLVEVNAVVVDETHYTLHMVSSNIPTRKYVQWIENLKRTVAALAI